MGQPRSPGRSEGPELSLVDHFDVTDLEACLVVPARQLLDEPVRIQERRRRRRVDGGVQTGLEGEHHFDRAPPPGGRGDRIEAFAILAENASQQAAPGEDHGDPIRHAREVRCRRLDALPDAEQVGNAAPRRLPASAPSDRRQRLDMGIDGHEEAGGIAARPPVRTPPVAASKIDVDGARVSEEFGSDLGSVADGDPRTRDDSHEVRLLPELRNSIGASA